MATDLSPVRTRRNQLDVLEEIAANTAEGSGGGGGGPDRELAVSYFRAKNAFTGASVGDSIRAMSLIDVTGSGPTQIGDTLWFNESTQQPLASAPAAANLEPGAASGLTNAQLVAAFATQTNALNGTLATEATQSGMSAKLPASLGGKTSAASLSMVPATDSSFTIKGDVATGTNASTSAPVKIGARYLSNPASVATGQMIDLRANQWGSLYVSYLGSGTQAADALANTTVVMPQQNNGSGSTMPPAAMFAFDGTNWNRLRASLTGGLAVDPLKAPTIGRTLNVTAASANVTLTASTPRVEIYARGADMRFVFGAAGAVATNAAPSLFIAQGERLVLPAGGAAIAAIIDSASGSQTGQLEITELA